MKYGVILDAEFFAWLEEQRRRSVPRRRTRIAFTSSPGRAGCKADVVEKDEREETGLRAVLNYGHTFATPSRRSAATGRGCTARRSPPAWCASRLAEKSGMIGADVTQRQIRLLERCSLPDRAANADGRPTN